MENGEQPAYPHDVIMETSFGSGRSSYSGLSKREAFAMAAMQGLCANPVQYGTDHVFLTKKAVSVADNILKVLSNKQP